MFVLVNRSESEVLIKNVWSYFKCVSFLFYLRTVVFVFVFDLFLLFCISEVHLIYDFFIVSSCVLDPDASFWPGQIRPFWHKNLF
jgi:hypothetical protein